MAQNAPNMKNLPGHQSYLCFLPSWWEKCIETSKKLIARVGTQHLLLGLHLPYGYQGKNAIFWLVSFLTPLIAWKTQTNIQKQLSIFQCPTRDPKSTKIELLDQIFCKSKWPWMLEKSIFCLFSLTFPNFLYPMDPETCRKELAHKNTSLGAQGVPFMANRIRF